MSRSICVAEKFVLLNLNIATDNISLDKSGYQISIFLISPQKHMLLVLIRSTSISFCGEIRKIYQYLQIEKVP